MLILLSLAVIVIDQYSKFYIQTHMLPGVSIPVIQNVFHITYVLNPGAAFGMLEHQTAFFILVASVLLAGAIYFYPRIPARSFMLRYGIGLQAGGAIGNVIDRVRTGYVVDFLDFRVWPVFNMADIAIVTGVGFIIFHILYLSGKEDENSDK